MVCTAANLSAARGWDVHVVYSRRPETPLDLSALFHKSVTLHEIPMGGFSMLSAVFALKRRINDLQPQIIHLHSSFAGFVGRIAAAASGSAPIVVYSPHCISVMRRDIGLKRFVFAALERLANLTPSTYIACSMSEKDEIRRWVGADAELLENAVEDVSIKSVAPPLEQSVALRIVTVGGVRTQKGPEDFALIAHLTLKSGINAEFAWVGDGDLEKVTTLVEGGVSVSGWLPKADVYSKLAAADVYLSTAKWEGLPVSIIEAMSSRKLVLAARCSGNVDVVDHGRTGLLFSDPDEATKLLASVATGAIETNHIRDAAYNEARSRFSIDRFDARLHEIYGASLNLTKRRR